MIVRLTAVVLRLSALYFMWQTLVFLGTFQLALTSEEGPYVGFVITIVVYLLLVCALWFFAGRLAPFFYPYEDQSSMPTSLDVDGLESIILQITGVVLVLLGIHDLLTALLNTLVVIVDHGYGLDGTVVFLSFSKGLLFIGLGLILLISMKGVIAWLGRLRTAGTK